MTNKATLAAALAGLLLSTAAAAASAACAPASAPDPVDPVRRMYAAAMQGDRAGILAELTPDFYAFDGGKRLSGPELAGIPDVIKAMHKTYVWSVTEPEVRRACDVAWATWTNRGTITDASGSQPATWLESAVMVWRDGQWKIDFFHSTRVAPAR